MTLWAGLVFTLAMGAAASVCMLLAVYKWVRKQGRTLSFHYFHVERRPREPAPLDRFMDSFSRGYLAVVLFFLLFVLSFAAARFLFLENPQGLAAAVGFLQGVLAVLLPMALGATALFATFKKPTYVLFSTQDVVKERRLLPLLFLATSAFLLAGASQVSALLAPQNDGQAWQLIFHSFAFLLLFTAGALCGIVLLRSHRILFSGDTAELKLLDRLNRRIYERDADLKLSDCGDARAVGLINRYLVERLQKRSAAFARTLARRPAPAQVVFWDATQAPPLGGGRHVLFQAAQSAKLVLAVSVACAGILWGLARQWCWPLLEGHPAAVLTAALCVLLLLALLYRGCRPLRQMGWSHAYGGWGYRFTDDGGLPCLYVSRGQLSHRSGPRWLGALFSLLALYRIELLNGYSRELPQALAGVLSETDGGWESFLLKLAHYLCGCLALERVSTAAEADAVLNWMLEALGDTWRDPLFFPWASALWADVKRDPDWYADYRRAGPNGAA